MRLIKYFTSEVGERHLYHPALRKLNCLDLANLNENHLNTDSDSAAKQVIKGKSKCECTSTSTIKTILYVDLQSKANKLCQTLLTKVAKNSIISVLFKSEDDVIAVLLSILWSSCAFYSVAADNLEFAVKGMEAVKANWLICEQEFEKSFNVEELNWKDETCLDLHSMGCKLYKLPYPVSGLVEQYNICYCITTSGTTGLPKTVHVPVECIVPNISHLKQLFEVTSEDKILLASPLTFDPSIVEIFLALTSGAELVVVSEEIKRSPRILLEALAHVTILQATPSLMRRFKAKEIRERLLNEHSKLRILALGGEMFPSPLEIASWLHPSNKTRMFNLYGITEVSCWASVCELDPLQHCSQEKSFLCPIGEPLTETEIKLSAISSTDTEAYIWIGSKTRNCLIDKNDMSTKCDKTNEIVWRCTGDLGQLNTKGEIVCLGRRDDQVKRNGKRLNLQALLEICRNLPFVDQCTALTEKNKLYLYIEVNTHGHPDKKIYKSTDECVQVYLTDNEKSIVRNEIKSHLPSYYQPTDIIGLNIFPITSHGKLNKRYLLAMAESTTSSDVHESTVDVKWAMILWKRILNKSEDIKADETFYQLGGDSLAAIRLVDDLEKIYNRLFPSLLDVIFNADFSTFCSKLKLFLQKDLTNVKQDENLHSNFVDDQKEKEKHLSQHKTILTKTEIDYPNSEKYLLNKNARELKCKSGTKVKRKHCLHSDTETSTQFQLNDKKDYCFSNLNENDNLLNSKRIKNEYLKTNTISIENQDSKIVTIFEDIKKSQFYSILRGNKIVLHKLKENSKLNDKTVLNPYLENRRLSSNETDKETDIENILNSNRNKETDLKEASRHIHPLKENCDSSHTVSVNKLLRYQWKHNTKKCIDASPLVIARYDSLVCYIGSHSGLFIAIHVSTGSCLWSICLPDRIESSACSSLDGSKLFVGCCDGFIYSISADSGEILWQKKTGDIVKCSPIIHGVTGYVYCGSYDGALYCLDAEEKKCVWKKSFSEGSIFASPVIETTRNIVYIGTLGGKLLSLSCTTGEIICTTNLGKPIFSSPSLLQTDLRLFVVIACVDGCLYCLDGSKIKWVYKAGGPIFSSPVVIDGRILFGCHDNSLYCVDYSGELKWTFSSSSPFYTTPFVVKECTVVKSTQSSMQSSSTQEKQFSKSLIPLSHSSRISPSSDVHPQSVTNLELSRNYPLHEPLLVFSATVDGVLYCLRANHGTLVDEVRLNGQLFSSPVVIGSNLLIGCRDDFLYCFDFANKCFL